MSYHELYIRGEGAEKLANSNRNKPSFVTIHPVRLNKFRVKEVELPLTFSPLVSPSEYTFTSTYTLDDGSSFVFTDTIVFQDYEIVTGDLICSKMQAKFVIHASQDIAAHLADASITITNNGAPTDTQLASGPLMSVNTSLPIGVPKITITQALAAGTGVTTCDSLVVNVVNQSLLASLFDFPYNPTAAFPNAELDCSTVSGATIVTAETLPQMRTRPSYLLLHSNLRAGAVAMSTSSPLNSGDTAIAKITIPQSSDIPWGETAIVWQNPLTDADTMYNGDNRDYNFIEFWMTYPDGKTMARFSGNSFSLTLSFILYGTFP